MISFRYFEYADNGEQMTHRKLSRIQTKGKHLNNPVVLLQF